MLTLSSQSHLRAPDYLLLDSKEDAPSVLMGGKELDGNSKNTHRILMWAPRPQDLRKNIPVSKASVLNSFTSIQLKRNRKWVDFNFVGWSPLGSLWGRRWWREGEAGAAGVWTVIYVKKAHHNEKLFLDKCWWSKMRRPSVFRWQLKAFPFYSWAVYISAECL